MAGAVSGTSWRLQHSLWVLATFTVGIANWAAFLYIGVRARQKKWILWGVIYAFSLVCAFVFYDTAQKSILNIVFAMFAVTVIGSPVHALVVRNEYLARLATLEGTTAAVTKRGSTWEWGQSLWIALTFTVGVLNWAAFLYIGLRAKQAKWLCWSAAYLLILVVMFALRRTETPFLYNLVSTAYLFTCIGSVGHAFAVRREYLLRLAARDSLPTAVKPSQQRQDVDQRILAIATPTSSGTVTPIAEQPGMSPPATKLVPPLSVSEPQFQEEARPKPPVPKSTSAMQAPTDTSPNDPASLVRSQQRKIEPVKVGENLGRVGETHVRQIADSMKYEAYPFPLAFGFRSLESIVNPLDLYREQLRVAENILAFVGSVSLVLIEEENRSATGINPLVQLGLNKPVVMPSRPCPDRST